MPDGTSVRDVTLMQSEPIVADCVNPPPGLPTLCDKYDVPRGRLYATAVVTVDGHDLVTRLYNDRPMQVAVNFSRRDCSGTVEITNDAPPGSLPRWRTATQG